MKIHSNPPILYYGFNFKCILYQRDIPQISSLIITKSDMYIYFKTEALQLEALQINLM